MSQLNPVAGSIVQSTQVQRAQSADRETQIRKQQIRIKDPAAPGDQFEHTVESSDAIRSIHEQEHSNQQSSKRKRHGPESQEQMADDAIPSLDLTA